MVIVYTTYQRWIWTLAARVAKLVLSAFWDDFTAEELVTINNTYDKFDSSYCAIEVA